MTQNYGITKYFLIFSILTVLIYLSGCIFTDYSYSNNYSYDSNYKTESDKVIDNYTNKLASCDNNDPCQTAYLDNNYNCQYRTDSKCVESRDNNLLKIDFDAKTLSCNNALKANYNK